MQKRTIKARNIKMVPKKSVWLKRLVRINTIIVAGTCAFYFLVGFVFDSNFFIRDAKEKYNQVLGATTLRVRVIGLPGKPTVTAVSKCSLAVPYINLTWSEGTDTDYFNIDRNGNLLVSSYADVTYNDSAIQRQTPYTYVVTAYGPVGNTPSDPAVITPEDCLVITTFDKINLIGYSGTPSTSNQTPDFTGSTSILQAVIDVSINGPTQVVAQTQANINGYWSLKSPVKLKPGDYTFQVTATDPNNSSVQKTASLAFNIKEEEEEEEEEEEKEKKETAIISVPPPVTAAPSLPAAEIKVPFKLSLEVENEKDIVYSGTDLKLDVEIVKVGDFSPQEKELTYRIVDSNNNLILETKDKVFVSGSQTIRKSINIPRLLKMGRYKVSVETSYGDIVVSAEHYFTVQEVPLVQLGGGMMFTLTQIMVHLGWAILILLILLIVFLTLLLIEHHLSKKALIQITEEILQKKGFISRRKGVSQ